MVGHETVTGKFVGLWKKFENNVGLWNIFKFAFNVYLHLPMRSERYPTPTPTPFKLSNKTHPSMH